MIAVDTKISRHFSFEIDFSKADYANLSFFASDFREISLHLSLRQRQQSHWLDRILRPNGIVVLNQRYNDTWQKERKRNLKLHAGLNHVEIIFSDQDARIVINGRIFRREPCDSNVIRGFDYTGAFVPPSIQAQPIAASLPRPAQPQISVIVPVYNVENLIGVCLKTLQGQSFTDFEVLVIDDGSTDASHFAAQIAVQGDSRFVLERFENMGLSEARNRGLERARGQFIAFVDGDDRVEPNYLERLHQALVADDGDLVACGLRYVSPDFTGTSYRGTALLALHGPAPANPEAPACESLTDWTQVIRHYPSAWNKLYRRSLIGDLRFDVGTYYEDHAFFWQLASRTDHMLRLPDPLYLQTQGRDGQITREDSDRVFEQFGVLERLRTIIANAPNRNGGAEAFERITSRLLYERSLALRNPERRARFVAAAREFFARHDITWSPEWDPTIGRNFGLTLDGKLSLSVILINDGELAPVNDSLTALSNQGWWDFETLVICTTTAAPLPPLEMARVLPACKTIVEARAAALVAARGEYVLFLTAGQTPDHYSLEQSVEMVIRGGPPPYPPTNNLTIVAKEIARAVG